ncbi:MAG: WXG100 family type VII secretion target [Chloroflexi bacterium]|nr:MAG: WXG100 family type VII secretion target [Chloroflexota bacterium]
MPADKIEANYEVLENVSNMFQSSHEQLKSMFSNVKSCMESLLSEGWIGRGSDAYESEMNEEVLPQLQRLVDAMDQASQITRRIAQTMQDAEENAGSFFRR